MATKSSKKANSEIKIKSFATDHIPLEDKLEILASNVLQGKN